MHMRTFHATLLASVAIVAIAGCHDSSAPLQPVNFLLSNIDGRPLPTTITPIPESPTVLSGSFLFDGGSHAIASERRRDMSGNEYQWTVRYRYTIAGNVVRFDYDPPCGGPAVDCAIIPKGTLDGPHLLIDYSGGNNSLVYDYVHFMPD